ncbi:Hint domain-containing protein [Marinovum sp.]|uniref:Hint domain-containing protein n=1 Tax=Marinovum sp. TaxID=2024839 RepID=UPI002B2730E2|nr:Hint domain-containing protein [Marinovum sp.]
MPVTDHVLRGGIAFNELHAHPTTDHNNFNDGTNGFQDMFVEFTNVSGAAIDIGGLELWGFDGVNFALLHTFPPGTSLGPGEHFTLVDSERATGTSPNNIGGGQSDFSDHQLWWNDPGNLYLHDPGANQHIVLTGPATNFDAADDADFLAENPGSTEIGRDQTPANPGPSDQSFQRTPDGEEGDFDSATATPGTENQCFTAGTAIATPAGQVAVECLVIGDMVTTAGGGAAAVRWVGRQTARKKTSGLFLQPVRVRAGALGGGLPRSDLTLTGDHGLVIDGLVINASALVNGHTIAWVPLAELPDEVTYYHLETEAHDVILAEGAPAETFIDYIGRQSFDNHAEYLALYGAERIIREMPMPRISAPRLVPAAIKARLGIVHAEQAVTPLAG